MALTVDPHKLQSFIPFDNLSDDHIRHIIPRVECIELPASRVVFKRDQANDNAYFLVEGALDLADEHFNITHLDANDDENYLSFASGKKHKKTAITTEPSCVYVLPRWTLDIVNDWIEIGQAVESKSDIAWMDALLASGLFSQVPPAHIQSLFSSFESLAVEMGETVIHEDAKGDTFYVIKKGYALVRKQQSDGHESVVAALGPGQFFGDDSLISGEPRGASVIMASGGEMMCLSEEKFRHILHESVIRHINEDELETLQEETDLPCILLDTRPDDIARFDRIPNAKQIPITKLRQSLDLEPNFFYAVCDRPESRSELAAYLLMDAGFEAYVLDAEDEQQEESTTEKMVEKDPSQTAASNADNV